MMMVMMISGITFQCRYYLLKVCNDYNVKSSSIFCNVTELFEDVGKLSAMTIAKFKIILITRAMQPCPAVYGTGNPVAE